MSAKSRRSIRSGRSNQKIAEAGRSEMAEEKNVRPILTVMPDFGMGPFIWWNHTDSTGVGGNCCASWGRCDNHPMSDSLFEAFDKWITEFETAPWTEGSLVDPSDRDSSDFAASEMIMNWPDFHVRGLALARRLKQEVGAEFRVVYEKPMEDPAYREDERREVLDDGSVILIPSRR